MEKNKGGRKELPDRREIKKQLWIMTEQKNIDLVGDKFAANEILTKLWNQYISSIAPKTI